MFTVIFWYPWQEPKLGQHDYVIFPDSSSYIGYTGWFNPWRTVRSIGYPAVIYPFLYPDQHKFLEELRKAQQSDINVWAEDEIYAIASRTGLGKKLESVVLLQRIMLALAISLFYLSLCEYFGPNFSFVSLFVAVWLAPPADPRFILTEPLSCALAYICAAFLLYSQRITHQVMCLASASFCAAFAFLVRPQMLSLVGLCTLIFPYQLFSWARKDFRRTIVKAALAFSPLLLAYGYIAWLSVTGGQLFLHKQANIGFSSFCYYAETADTPYMPTERARKLASWFGEHKKEFIDEINKLRNDEQFPSQLRATKEESPVFKRYVLGDMYVYNVGMPQVWSHFKNESDIGRLSLLEQNILSKELNTGLIYRHKKEMIELLWQNFIGALGYYKDVWHLIIFPNTSFEINSIVLVCILFAVMVSVKARWPVLILTGIHLMTILAAAAGHFVIQRYVDSTEAFLLLAGMCSLWTLGEYGWVCLQHEVAYTTSLDRRVSESAEISIGRK